MLYTNNSEILVKPNFYINSKEKNLRKAIFSLNAFFGTFYHFMVLYLYKTIQYKNT